MYDQCRCLYVLVCVTSCGVIIFCCQLAWMDKAVDIFRQRLVAVYPDTHPQLYMNLIGTSVSDSQITDFMVTSFTPEELSAWAILDTHVYYAWNAGLSGCTVLNDDCGWTCSVDTDESAFASVKDQIRGAAAASHSNFLSNTSIPLQGCSEFSLATYHDSNNACRGFNMLEMMYSAQADGFQVHLHIVVISSKYYILCFNHIPELLCFILIVITFYV